MKLTLQQLKVFATIARYGNLGLAANELCLSKGPSPSRCRSWSASSLPRCLTAFTPDCSSTTRGACCNQLLKSC